MTLALLTDRFLEMIQLIELQQNAIRVFDKHIELHCQVISQLSNRVNNLSATVDELLLGKELKKQC